jgi:hypothetical protein
MFVSYYHCVDTLAGELLVHNNKKKTWYVSKVNCLEKQQKEKETNIHVHLGVKYNDFVLRYKGDLITKVQQNFCGVQKQS